MSHPADLRRRWVALFFLFGLPGVVLSSWVTRTPAFRDAAGTDVLGMGLILLGLSIGSMAGILLSAHLTRRWGARRAVLASSTAILLGAALLALAGALALGVPAFLGLLCFGWGMGASEVGINTEGARLEVDTGKPLLSTLHAGFSIGTVLGAAVGFAMDAGGVPLGVHLGGVLLVLLAPAVLAVRALPARTGPTLEGGGSGARDRVDRRIVLIGVVVLGMAFGEGTANDWLPLVMVDGHGVDAAVGALAYLGFAAAMAAGRFAGPAAIMRFGRVAVLRACAVLAVTGLLLVVASPVPAFAVGAALIWGIGASVGFPIAISAAADGAADPERRVGQVVTTGYLAFLVGPPLLGTLGDVIGLRGAIVVVLVMVAVVVVVAGSVGAPRAGVRES
ncbi:MAG: MFS transporter [Microbacteriaceae bacterium]|nr:MAG: MFS transporter [Microbacteriaceae bacterium]